MLGTIVDLFTTGGVGSIFAGLTGLVGGWLAKREQRKLLELTNAHDEKMANIDLLRDQAERDHALLVVEKNIEQAEVEGQIATDIRDVDAFVESMRNADRPTGSKVFDGIKSAMRPILTVALLWVTYDIYTELDTLVGGLEELDPKMVQQLFVYVIHSIIYLTITAVAWWFASRGEKAVSAIKGMMKT